MSETIFMLPGTPTVVWSRVWQVVNGCFAAVVLSYVFFDLLDLDGSTFAKVFNAARPPAFETFTATEPELDASRKHFTPLIAGVRLVTTGTTESAYQRRSDTVQLPLLHHVQAHGYRLGLARSSLTEKSPDD